MCLKFNLMPALTVIFIIQVLKNGFNSEKVKGPDFCNEHILDSAYSDHKNRIRLTKHQWLWTFIENQQRMSLPNRLDPGERYKVQSIAHISAVPQCRLENGTYCADIRWAKDLLIMTYKLRKRQFAGAYQVKKVVDGVVTQLNDKIYLPFGLKPKGNLFSTEETFWPKELATDADNLDKSHVILAYNPYDYGMIVLANALTKCLFCFNALHVSHKWTDSWKCRYFHNDWQFVGAFLRMRTVYVLAVKDNDNQLFTISEEQGLMSTNIDVQNYFECNKQNRTQSLSFSSKDEEKSSKSLSTVWVIIAFIVFVAVVMVFGLIAFCATRKIKPPDQSIKPATPQQPSGAGYSRRSKLKIADGKGKEVDDANIGALDSKVSWDIVIAQPSAATSDDKEEPQPPKPKHKAKGKPASPTPGNFKKKT